MRLTVSLVIPCLLVAVPLLAAQSNAAAKAQAADQAAGSQSEAGLYMTFETDFGNIRCKLFEKETPITVRKIVGLAIGKVPYVDPQTRKEVKGKRFFDGLTFHRVSPQFMIQGGDPLGTGYGGPEGPGFPFQDEFVPSIRFDVPGRLAMANSGPNTNGSQLFISEVPLAYLNGKHTIFGQCSDISVVKAIARVPRDQDDRPNKPVLIKKVVVERIGPAPADAPESLPGAPPR